MINRVHSGFIYGLLGNIFDYPTCEDINRYLRNCCAAIPGSNVPQAMSLWIFLYIQQYKTIWARFHHCLYKGGGVVCHYLLPVCQCQRKRAFSIKLPAGVRRDTVNIPFYFNNRRNKHIVSKNGTWSKNHIVFVTWGKPYCLGGGLCSLSAEAFVLLFWKLHPGDEWREVRITWVL